MGRRLAVALLALAALGVALAPAAAGQTRVRFAFTPRLTQAPVYIAQEKGLFKQEGLDVELVLTRGASTEILPLFVRGDVDVAMIGPSAAIFNAVAEGIAFQIVADGGRIDPASGGDLYVLLVRKDLWDGGKFRTLADLKGKTIGFGARGTTLAVMMYRALEQAGLRESDVTIKWLTNPADMTAALVNKAVDANAMMVPTHLPLVDNGTAVVWKEGRDLAPGLQGLTLVYGERFLRGHPDAARRFLRAYLRAVRWYLEELRGKNEELITLSAKWTKMDPATIRKASWPYFSPNGHPNVEDIEKQQELWRRLGLVKNRVDLARVVDGAILAEVLKDLGTIPEPKPSR